MSVVNVFGIADTGESVTTLPAIRSRDGDLSFRTTRDSVDGGIILGYRLANRMSAYHRRHHRAGEGTRRPR